MKAAASLWSELGQNIVDVIGSMDVIAMTERL